MLRLTLFSILLFIDELHLFQYVKYKPAGKVTSDSEPAGRVGWAAKKSELSDH